MEFDVFKTNESYATFVNDYYSSADGEIDTVASNIDYLKRYPDVANNWKSTAWRHYEQNGKREGRSWVNIEEDLEASRKDYLERYPDVANNWQSTPERHFYENGLREGRIWNVVPIKSPE